MSGVLALCCGLLLGVTAERPHGTPRLDGRISRFELHASLGTLRTSECSPRPSEDAWLGQDKLKHLTTSFAATTMGYAGLRATGLDHRPAATLAIVGAGALGVLKEIYDRKHQRPFSLRDLAWDAVGVLAGAALVDRTR